MHWLDAAYTALTRRPVLFSQGWGNLAPVEELSAHLRSRPAPSPLRLHWSGDTATAHSPCGLLPKATSTIHLRRIPARGTARARLLVPPSWGDEGFGMRTFLFGALAESGIEVWLHEGAFFGARRIPNTPPLALSTVAEFMLMGLADVLELRDLTVTEPGPPVTIAGYSMAGMLAALTSATLPFELPVAALVPSDNAGPVFLDGPLGQRIDFGALGDAARPRLRETFERHGVATAPIPLTEKRIVVATRRDGLVPPSSQQRVAAHWNVTPMWLDSGHLGAYVFERSALRRAVLGGLGLQPGARNGPVDDST